MDAIESVEQIKDRSLYELIIVNDGSTDEYTNEKLKELQRLGYDVIFQENKGLATTRNVAIARSKGKYILPLDADNKIKPEYIYEAIDILDNNDKIAIVYSDAELFGEASGIKSQHTYNLQRLMLYNTIDACAVYRKEVWEELGGYDKNMPYPGLEDWNMWLEASFKGYKFHYINKPLFYYRILSDSMIRNINGNKIRTDKIIDYLDQKHSSYFGQQYIDEFFMHKLDQSPSGFIAKIIIRKYFPSLYRSFVNKGRFRKFI